MVKGSHPSCRMARCRDGVLDYLAWLSAPGYWGASLTYTRARVGERPLHSSSRRAALAQAADPEGRCEATTGRGRSAPGLQECPSHLPEQTGVAFAAGHANVSP